MADARTPSLRERLLVRPQSRLDLGSWDPGETFGHQKDTALGELTAGVGGKPSSVGFSLWALYKRGLIGREKVRGKVYFGSRDAIASLRQGLGPAPDKAFEKAIANAEKIRKRIGKVGSLDLLDELRSER